MFVVTIHYMKGMNMKDLNPEHKNMHRCVECGVDVHADDHVCGNCTAPVGAWQEVYVEDGEGLDDV